MGALITLNTDTNIRKDTLIIWLKAQMWQVFFLKQYQFQKLQPYEAIILMLRNEEYDKNTRTDEEV